MKNPSGSRFAFPATRVAKRIRLRKAPVQERSKETTEAIVEATLQVLVDVGWSRLTTTRVAARAGVSVGTLYQYFPDKRSLVTALKVRYFGLMVRAVGDAIAAAGGDGLEPTLRAALGALLRVKRENLALSQALRTPMVELDGGSFVRETLEQFVAVLVPVIAKRGRASARLERRVTIVVAALDGAISHAVYESPAWLTERWFEEELVRLALGYLEE